MIALDKLFVNFLWTFRIGDAVFPLKMYWIVEGYISDRQKGGMPIQHKTPTMTYSQYRKARKLVHECCNYDNGSCIALDNGEGCVCVQSISYSLICKWFRIAVLPLDRPLETELLYRASMKRCDVCGQPYLPGSNRAKYCKSCASKIHRRQKTESGRKRRLLCGQLESKKSWLYRLCRQRSEGMRDKSLMPPKIKFLTVHNTYWT